MKTIFITLSDGEVSKSIIQSSVLGTLSREQRVVLLVPQNKLEFFRRTVGSPQVVVEVIPPTPHPRLEEAFADVFLYSLHTDSVPVKIEHSYYSGGGLLGRTLKYLLWWLGVLAPYRAVMRLLYRLVPDRSFDQLFAQYQPGLVFAANLTSMEDARLLKAARRRGIKSLGMPKGWDNLTLKTFLPVFSDQLLVQNELMREDAARLGYPKERVTIVGFPKFDIYADHSALMPREQFMQAEGLDPAKKFIVYAGAGDQLAPYDEDILADFLDAIEDGTIEGSPQVLVRPHPKYAYHAERIAPRAFWVLDRPGTVVGNKQAEFEFSRADVGHLMNTLYHADLLVHTASTLGVEACIFDKPSITLAYDGHAQVPKELSTARYYAYIHLERVAAAQGMKVARSFDELVRYANEYLKDPSLDRAGRQQIVRENAHTIDGKAGERIAEAVLTLCKAKER